MRKPREGYRRLSGLGRPFVATRGCRKVRVVLELDEEGKHHVEGLDQIIVPVDH
jgi:hypothetical protein